MAGLTITADLRGVEATQRKFSALAGKAQGVIARRTVRAGLRPQLARAKASTAYVQRTGRLKKSLGVSVRKGRERGQIWGRVLTRKGGRHGIPLEFGHRIAVDQATGRSEKNVVLRRRDRRPKKTTQRYGVSGGRVVPRPFLCEAFHASKGAAEKASQSEFVIATYEVARG
jgi:hypothetical protein